MDDNDLIVAASSATATRLAQGAYPGNTMDQVRWLASIGADYGVIAVATDSPMKTLPELLDQIKADPTSVSVAGGSAVGGWDHLKVLIAANAYGIDDVRSVKYVAFDGGGEAVTQLLAGSVQAFTGDISEAKGFVDSGDIKVLAVLAPSAWTAISPISRPPRNRASTPSAPTGAASTPRAACRTRPMTTGSTKIADLYASDEWKEVMAGNGLAPLDLQGAEFEEFVADSVGADPADLQGDRHHQVSFGSRSARRGPGPAADRPTTAASSQGRDHMSDRIFGAVGLLLAIVLRMGHAADRGELSL